MMHHSSLGIYGVLAVRLGVLLGSGSPANLGCTQARSQPLPESLTIFYSNDTENELYRCVCKSNQMGGMPRRATLILDQDANPELVVDTGNFSARRPGKEYDEFKLEYLMRIYDMLGYSALNAGPMEVDRGKELLLDLAELAGGKLISANVVDDTGTLLLPPYRIVEVDGLRLGIVGLTDQMPLPGKAPGLSVIDPVESFGEVWAEVDAASDMQVVLSQLHDEELMLLRQTYPDIDVILGGPDWRTNSEMEPWIADGILMGRVGSRGKYLGRIDLTFDNSDRRAISVAEYSGEAQALSDRVPANAEVDNVLEEFRERLRKGEVFQDIYESMSHSQQFGFAGSIYCQDCHGKIYAGQLRNRHSQAFQTLAQKGEQYNPDCLQCHTVGYDQEGGYAAKGNNYLLANVQCENCHGAGAPHMAFAVAVRENREPPPNEGGDWLVPDPAPQSDTCIQCHTPDNDPHWSGDAWPYELMLEQVGCSQFLSEKSTTP